MVVGASVLAITYKDGVMLMADTGASYGSLARFTDVPRLIKVNDNTVVGFGGELSDFQYIETNLKALTTEDFVEGDGMEKTPEQIHAFLCGLLHDKRNEGDPLWNQLVTGGIAADGKPFLGYVDLYGTNFKDDVVATGFGLHMAAPLLRKLHRPDLDAAQARQALEDSMRVLLYRHCRAINKFQIATITADGVNISDTFSLETQWEYRRFVNPRAQE